MTPEHLNQLATFARTRPDAHHSSRNTDQEWVACTSAVSAAVTLAAADAHSLSGTLGTVSTTMSKQQSRPAARYRGRAHYLRSLHRHLEHALQSSHRQRAGCKGTFVRDFIEDELDLCNELLQEL